MSATVEPTFVFREGYGFSPITSGEIDIFHLPITKKWRAIKYRIGRLPLPEPPWQFVPKRLARDAITVLRIETMHALHVAGLPLHHKDPFDRLIISQSIHEDIPIMTADKQFEPYDVEIIWAG